MDTIDVTADALALNAHASMLIDAGRAGAAKPILAAARALLPGSADLELVRARLAVSEGAIGEAVEILDTGLAATPGHLGLRKYRADVRRSLGDWEGAARDAAEVVVVDCGDPHAKAILGQALLGLGHVGEAVACLNEAVAAVPGDASFREALAMALDRSGDADAALAVLSEGVSLTPASISLRNAAILLCVRRRDFIRAVRLAEQARSVGIVDACTFGMAGHALSSLGQHEAAAAAYREALKLGPEDPYVRHLVVSSGMLPGQKRAPEGYIRTVFDGYADRFDTHLTLLEYRVPAAIRTILQDHPAIDTIGPVLDLGCGTGMVALAVSDLPLGPFTGVDLSPRMLSYAEAKGLYEELREADIVADLTAQAKRWKLIVAADVLCYFGALEEILALVHRRLAPGGWFIFSVEQILPDHDGIVPGNGRWALQRQGRYVHAEDYVYEAICQAGFRILRMDRPVIRQEAGAGVPGLLFAIERMRHDG